MPAIDKAKSRVSDSGAQEPTASMSKVVVSPPAPEDDIFERIWRFFCSMRLALILILVITAAVFVGTLIDQAPGGMDPSDTASWLARAQVKYGAYTGLMNTLQLFIIYSSLWFKLLLAALMMNIIVCTMNRWHGVWTMVSKPRIKLNESYFRRAGKRASYTGASVTLADGVAKVREVLAARRYRVLSETDAAGATYLYADRNRYGKLGTFLNHLSFIVLLAGVIMGSVLGFRQQGFTVPEGSTRDVGFGTNLSVACEAFADEYYPDGPPKDYRSDLILYKNGIEVARKTIRVNEPLQYDGINFYQSFFGPAAIIQVKDKTGNQIFQDGVALAFTSGGATQRSLGNFDLPEQGLMVYVVAPKSGSRDPQIAAGDVRVEVYKQGSQTPLYIDTLSLGKGKVIGDLEYTFVRERQFTGLQVSKDPGTMLIWIASTLMVIGLVMVFYFPHRRLWALVQRTAEGKTEILLGATAGRDQTFSREFDELAEQMSARLKLPLKA